MYLQSARLHPSRKEIVHCFGVECVYSCKLMKVLDPQDDFHARHLLGATHCKCILFMLPLPQNVNKSPHFIPHSYAFMRFMPF